MRLFPRLVAALPILNDGASPIPEPDAVRSQRDPFTAAFWNGRDIAVVVRPPMRGRPSVDEQARALFDRELEPAEWAELVGAPDGAGLEVISEQVDLGSVVLIRVNHSWYDGTAIRVVFRDEEGMTAVKNEMFVLRSDAPDGVGTRVLAHQVRKATSLGVAYLEAEAAGGPGSPYVGYIVWPRLGFGGAIPPAARRRLDGLPDDHPLRSARDVLELTTRPGGRAWWRANGAEFHAYFDLGDGSASRRVLAAYTDERGIVL